MTKFAILCVCLYLSQVSTEIDLHNGRIGKCECKFKSYTFNNNLIWLNCFIVWPIGLVRFANSVCNSTSNLFGTCYRRRQCIDINGIQDGRCASNIGVCCVSK